MRSTNAVFVGDASLLVRCAQAWRDAGHSVALVASGSAEVLDWARDNRIECLRIDEDAPLRLPAIGFDYLFSIAYLSVLGSEVISRPRELAINFHDGPLPRYAGLNAPAWALMDRSTQHGITWHEMTSTVDAGRIVRQVLFDVADNETALSLNARCYEAGLASFTEIARDIAHGPLELKAQVGPRSYFGRNRRPAALATLDFARTATEIAALVRALDFGNYLNPLARPKIDVGDRLLLVRRAALPEDASQERPGTVVSSADDSLRVATGAGDIVLSGLTEMSGAPAALPARGRHLPLLDARVRIQLDAAAPRVARGESYWTRVLAALAPVEVPYPRQRQYAIFSAAPQSVPLAANAAAASSLAGFAAWLSALSGQERITVLYSDAPLRGPARGQEKWLEPWVPLNLQTRPDSRAGELVAAAQERITAAHAAGAMARDLPTRLGDKSTLLSQVQVAFSPDAVSAPPGVDLLLCGDGQGGLQLQCGHDLFSAPTRNTLAAHLSEWLRSFASSQHCIRDLALLPPIEAEALAAANATEVTFDEHIGVHEAIAAQAACTPERPALQWQTQELSYRELEQQAIALAAALVQQGVRPGDIVGLCLPRTPKLVVALLAILKAGAAYLPLDPDYPRERIAFMIEDSATARVVTTSELARTLSIAPDKVFAIDAVPLSQASVPATLTSPDPQRAAYVIYTSGSTGQPKGVVVTHRNVMNFFTGMDARIAHDPPGRWLAVTSLSFDISVLELCWTLARGFTVVLHSNTAPEAAKPTEFSLFYFASDHESSAQDRYRLLMEGARFADRNGFAAVWTPERHFHAFGGLYPNPAVTSAAIAAATSKVKILAGSCVLPLHHPIRVAEEWAFVDNISQGRVGIAFASGWQPNDFVFAPANFANRKNLLVENIEIVRQLWRGERLPFPGPDGKPVQVQTLPRPIQPELPVWVTAAGNPETFEQAGALGCHLLTHLLGQTVEEVADKLRLYRLAWRKAGHPGTGHVTLMLHTFVGDDDDAVRETVRQPMKNYLRSAVDLVKKAAWSFPTFVQRAAKDGRSPVEIMDAAPLSDEDMEALLEHAFNRYYGTSALFGTHERCLAMVEKLQSAGVDEIACLIDFGIDTQTVLDHLGQLKALMDASRTLRAVLPRVSVGEQVVAEGVTHLQCTPSMASMLVADAAGRAALSQLQALLVGGEALPLPLARELQSLVPGPLINMYGPTETTVWSTTCELRELGDFAPLGAPIANTQLRVRTPWGLECPALVPGELLIGGAGVTRGYLGRAELTAQKFIADAHSPNRRWYRTGDLVRRHPGGAIEFLGRIDHQVKIRGHRIELGEIESVLLRQRGVKDAVAIARDGAAGEKRLIAYVTPTAEARPDPAQLRQALSQTLPEFMVPQSVLVLPALPMTPNGKVDRNALPESQAMAVRPAGSAPEGELEQTIASIWQEVLGLQQVGTTENFFDLGGHSLLVVQVQRRLREACGREVSITDMFRLPTIKALAAHLGGQVPTQSAVDDGLSRAKARRLMRTRAPAQPSTVNPVA